MLSFAFFTPFCRRRFSWQQALPSLQSGNRQRSITTRRRTVITRTDESQRRNLRPPLMPGMFPLIAPPRPLTSPPLPPFPLPGYPRPAPGSLRHTPRFRYPAPGSLRRTPGLPNPLTRSLHRRSGRRTHYPISPGLPTSASISYDCFTSPPLHRIFPSAGFQSRFLSLSCFGSRCPSRSHALPRPGLTLSPGLRPSRLAILRPDTHPLLHHPAGILPQGLIHHQPYSNPSHRSSRCQPTKAPQPGPFHLHDGHARIKPLPHERPGILCRRYRYRAVLRCKK